MNQFLSFEKVMQVVRKSAPAVILSATLLVSCKKDDHPGYPGKPPGIEATVVKGSGDISAQLAQFRSLMGDSLNVSLPGNPAGRREVNWDGVPAGFTDPFAFPADFFNATDPAIAAGRKRGLLYATNDSSFRVSNKSFIDIDSSYATQFAPFSAPRVFTRLGTNVAEVVFKVPGTTVNASVKGLGIIFLDVDDENATYLEFYEGNKYLGLYKAPVRTGNSNVSFLGVFFPKQKVTRVKITSGNGVLAKGVKDVSNGGTKDLVVMDDFFYSEPAQF
jgi:hypothetical protein